MNLGLNYIKVIECSEVKRIKWIYQNEKETSNSEISINQFFVPNILVFDSFFFYHYQLDLVT